MGGNDYDVLDYDVLIVKENVEGCWKIVNCLSCLGFEFFDWDEF